MCPNVSAPLKGPEAFNLALLSPLYALQFQNVSLLELQGLLSLCSRIKKISENYDPPRLQGVDGLHGPFKKQYIIHY